MDIPALSMQMSQARLLSDVGVAVLDMQMDATRSQAASEVASLDSMPAAAMELSVNPSVGGNLDISV